MDEELLHPSQMEVGSTFIKTVTRGKNKGDVVKFRVAPSGKPYPIEVLKTKGNSTLKGKIKFAPDAEDDIAQ